MPWTMITPEQVHTVCNLILHVVPDLINYEIVAVFKLNARERIYRSLGVQEESLDWIRHRRSKCEVGHFHGLYSWLLGRSK